MDRPPDSLPPFADLLLDAVFLVDAAGRIVHVSAACEGIFGYTQAEMIGRQMFDFVAPEDRAKTLEESTEVMAGRPRIGFENRYLRKDGSRVHLMWSARWAEKEQLRIGVARDVTELRQAQQLQAATYAISEAAHNTNDLASLFEAIHLIIEKLVPLAGLAVATLREETRELHLGYCSGFKEEPSRSRDRTILEYCTQVLLAEQGIHLPPEALQAASLDTTFHFQHGWLMLPLVIQEELIGAIVLACPPETSFASQEKELLRFVAEQVTTAVSRKQAHAELVRSARHDDLTGLPNRRLFHDRLNAALSRCKRRGKRMAVLFIDINGFKQVNDSFGHDIGDLLLQDVALRLKQSLREEDTIARLGGDEFTVLLEDIATQDEAFAVADKIRHLLSGQILLGHLALSAGASVGVAFYPEDGNDSEQLLKHADQAMYADKSTKADKAEV